MDLQGLTTHPELTAEQWQSYQISYSNFISCEKKALVFGGTSGIGLATCKLLIEKGVSVVAIGRSKDKMAAAIEEIEPLVPKDSEGRDLCSIIAREGDVLDREWVQRFCEHYLHRGVDYLVCAATGGERAMGPFLDMDLDGFQGSFAKLWGYANCVKSCVPHMKADGSVVLVSGTPAKRYRSGQIALSCVGGAVENMTKALANELAPRRVNCVSPGVIDTPMFSKFGAAKDERLAAMTAGNPIARPGAAEEVAAAVVFALENAYMTGAVLEVDGGLVVAPPK
jgi:NAD(P)-dependent dehydrogenase (short-subunit alcohol dehydrogenase family)